MSGYCLWTCHQNASKIPGLVNMLKLGRTWSYLDTPEVSHCMLPGLLVGTHARALLQSEYLEQNKKKAKKVPLQKKWVLKIILEAQEHPKT